MKIILHESQILVIIVLTFRADIFFSIRCTEQPVICVEH